MLPLAKQEKTTYAAIILAAGSGNRANTTISKQYLTINGRALLNYSLSTFINSQIFSQIILVIAPRDQRICQAAINPADYNKIETISGGETRQDSTWQALTHLANNSPDYVVIHDAARPFISINKLEELCQNTTTKQGATLAIPVSDSLKKVNKEGLVLHDISRDNVYAAQTPQAFPFKEIFNAHLKAKKEQNHIFTDDSSLAESYGLPVKIIPGCSNNIKITWPEDIEIAEAIANKIF